MTFALSQLSTIGRLPKSGVYRLNFPNGKFYIGCSASQGDRASIKCRLYSYYYNKCRFQKKLLAALRKYDHSVITVDILLISDDPAITFAAEADFIKSHDSQDRNKGYNTLPGGLLSKEKVVWLNTTKKRDAERRLRVEQERVVRLNTTKKRDAERRLRVEQERVDAKNRFLESQVRHNGYIFKKGIGGEKMSDERIKEIVDESLAMCEERKFRKRLRLLAVSAFNESKYV